MPQAHVRMTFTAAFEVPPEHSLFNTRMCVLGDAVVGNHGFRKMFEF